MRVLSTERSLVFVLSCALAVVGAARAEVVEFHIDLDGICAATGSSATGEGSFTLETTTGLLEWVIVHDILDSGEFSAHIHGPNFAEICGLQADSPALIALSFGSPKIGSIILDAQQQQDFLADSYYVNIHSNGLTSAEIKGVIELVPPPVPTVSLWGLIALALMLLAGATIGIRRQIRSLSA